ncbi:hypothetical protein SEA_PUREGLOBE5_114 [Arthrobacter phage Pureglobe5]|nr:hypothetical protein PBI_BEAGLE_117 [Arthrobacter phage Beagle]UYL87477.1 hypothetical protein SEA_PUREGLOBE5_114 [Arthrobacter phage Pureglobe5]
MTDTITPETETVTSTDPVLDLLLALEIGDTVTVTKDHNTHTLTVVNILGGDTPYIIARGERDFTVGFDRATISHGIVEVSR